MNQPLLEPAATTDDRYEAFLSAFTPVQERLLMYINALVRDRHDAGDLFQEVCLVLWREFSQFRADGNFLQWALGIARHRVLEYWRARRHSVYAFNASLMETLADDTAAFAGELDARQEALNSCVEQLTDRQRELIRRFYGEGESASAVADAWGRSVHAIYKALKVLRGALMECVEQKLAEAK